MRDTIRALREEWYSYTDEEFTEFTAAFAFGLFLLILAETAIKIMG